MKELYLKTFKYDVRELSFGENVSKQISSYQGTSGRRRRRNRDRSNKVFVFQNVFTIGPLPRENFHFPTRFPTLTYSKMAAFDDINI